MFLLKTVSPVEATGKIAEIYGIFPKKVGVPVPLQLMSASQGMLERQIEIIKYYMSHPNLSFPLLAAIRFLCASECNYGFCINFNKHMLMAQGMTETDIEKMIHDPEAAPLEDKEKAMLKFVLFAVRSPNDVQPSDIEKLRNMGWADTDIYDAVTHGANMVGASIVNNAFTRS